MPDVTFTIDGVESVIRAFDRLPAAAQKRILRPGLRKGAGIIRKQAGENVKAIVSGEATHTLEKSIVVRAVKSRSKSDVRVAVAIAAGKVNPKNGQRIGLYGSVLEHGKENQAPRPWLRPAHRQKADEAVNAVVETGRQKLSEMVDDAKRPS